MKVLPRSLSGKVNNGWAFADHEHFQVLLLKEADISFPPLGLQLQQKPLEDHPSSSVNQLTGAFRSIAVPTN